MTIGKLVVDCAHAARESLAPALLQLQTAAIPASAVAIAIEGTAEASNALYRAEAEATTDEAAASWLRSAVEHLTRALAEVRALCEHYPQCEVSANAIARTLALLYPFLQTTLRQRRGVRMDALSDSDASRLRALSDLPAAPPRLGRPSRPPGDFQGRERRTPGTSRVFVEVDIGVSSESHFYTGLSLDVSTGGVFVSTYRPVPPGTEVALFFVLPNGHAVRTEGVVRWTREGSSDAPPGMGVAFKQLSAEDERNIAEFCAGRPPLYVED